MTLSLFGFLIFSCGRDSERACVAAYALGTDEDHGCAKNTNDVAAAGSSIQFDTFQPHHYSITPTRQNYSINVGPAPAAFARPPRPGCAPRPERLSVKRLKAKLNPNDAVLFIDRKGRRYLKILRPGT